MHNITSMPLASLIATAQKRETAYRQHSTREEQFERHVQMTFPSLWNALHEAHAPCTVAGVLQWVFTIGDIEFCIMVQQEGYGTFWVFHAWDAADKHSWRRSSDYATPSPDTALLCFVGAALTKAEAAMLAGETMYVEAVA